jgi:hypothetical protein
MQYPDKRVDGVPIVTGIDERARPPLTAWGQARFDAAVPFMGPRAVAGKENNPSLRCEPEAVPKSLILPNPFEIVQTPDRVFMFFEEFHLWREIWTDGRPLPKNPDPSYLGYSVGKWDGDALLVVDTIGTTTGRSPFGTAQRTDAFDRALSPFKPTLEANHHGCPKAYQGVWINAPRLSS